MLDISFSEAGMIGLDVAVLKAGMNVLDVAVSGTGKKVLDVAVSKAGMIGLDVAVSGTGKKVHDVAVSEAGIIGLDDTAEYATVRLFLGDVTDFEVRPCKTWYSFSQFKMLCCLTLIIVFNKFNNMWI